MQDSGTARKLQDSQSAIITCTIITSQATAPSMLGWISLVQKPVTHLGSYKELRQTHWFIRLSHSAIDLKDPRLA